MPSVAFYGPRRVKTDPLPGVRQTAHETALSEGVGLDQARGQTAEALGRVGAETQTLGETVAQGEAAALREQTERAAHAAWESENKVDDWITQRKYGDGGAMLVKGKAALNETDKVLTDFDTFTGTVEAGLGTPAIKDNFRKRMGGRRVQLFRELEIHGAEQNDAYNLDQLGALVQNKQQQSIEAAVPRRGEPLDMIPIGTPLKDAVDALTTAAPQLGWSPEVLQKKLGDVRTSTHIGVVEKLLAQNLTSTAQAYFNANEKDISEGEPKNRLQAQLVEGTDLAQAQQAFDSILAKGGTVDEQVAQARQLPGKVRELTEKMLEQEGNRRDRQATLNDKAFTDQVYTQVQQTRTMPTDALTIGRLGAHLPELQHYVDYLSKGEPVPTDWARYYELMQQAQHSPASFVASNLLRDRARLADPQFTKLVDLQNDLAEKGDRTKADATLGRFRSIKELVDQSLGDYHIDPSAKPDTDTGRKITQLLRQVESQVEGLERPDAPGKPAHQVTNTEIQSIIDGLLSRKSGAPGSWWGLVPFNGVSFFGTEKRAFDTTIGDVPTADRARIESQFKSLGVPAPSDALILQNYLREMQQPGASQPGVSQAPIDRRTWSPRADGTAKGDGFFGALRRPDGGVMTEYSVSADLKNADGTPLDFPTLVPTLTAPEVQSLLTAKEGDPIDPAIVRKAQAYAQDRIRAGKPVWAQPGEQQPQLYPQFKRAQ